MPSVATGPADRPDPCVLVIFGASGDLTQRKLIPALCELDAQRLLPDKFAVLGVARTPKTDDEFRAGLLEGARKHAAGFDEGRWRSFAQRIHYCAADAGDTEQIPRVSRRIDELATLHDIPRAGAVAAGASGLPNILFYLSVAPQMYIPIIHAVGAEGLVMEGQRWCAINPSAMPWQRIIVEKPFGADLNSAVSLNRALGRVFEEDAIFRIDHYLGKELVQNILVLRFANRIVEPLWSREHVDHVQVTAAETVGVGSRAANFYDKSGCLRDMIQSHLLQVMTLIAMEPPSLYEPDALSSERIKVFEAIRPVSSEAAADHAVLGRYGKAADGPAYTEEPGVDPALNTDTYCAMRLQIDNWRWAGVPFYLRSGKRMARKLTEVVVQFKPPAVQLFRNIDPGAFAGSGSRPPNRIVMNIAPDEGVSLRFEAKVPGAKFHVDSAKMDMDYAATFKSTPVEAYGPLLLDAMRGDRTLYKHRLEVEGAWTVCQPFLDCADLRSRIETYEPNSWGPKSADHLLARDGRAWHNPTGGEKR